MALNAVPSFQRLVAIRERPCCRLDEHARPRRRMGVPVSGDRLELMLDELLQALRIATAALEQIEAHILTVELAMTAELEQAFQPEEAA